MTSATPGWIRTGVIAIAAVAALLPREGHAGPYEYFSTEHAEVRPAAHQGGLLLLGGGEWPDEAMPWFAEHAGRGHVVMIGASGDAEDHAELAAALGEVASLETLVLHDRESSSDPRVLAILARADGIFIHGGDQANYVRFWKGTPVADLIERRFREGCPVGGTSAGLAILGEWAYGSMDGGSLTSAEGLHDPLGPGVTLVGDFLHLAPLKGVITDSHFAPRGRLGLRGAPRIRGPPGHRSRDRRGGGGARGIRWAGARGQSQWRGRDHRPAAGERRGGAGPGVRGPGLPAHPDHRGRDAVPVAAARPLAGDHDRRRRERWRRAAGLALILAPTPARVAAVGRPPFPARPMRPDARARGERGIATG